nr:hypothetical protein [Variovorax boronicumulans]
MKRVLIALVSAVSVSAVVAFGPHLDFQASAQEPTLLTASWFADDGWAVVAAIIAMVLIANRRNR